VIWRIVPAAVVAVVLTTTVTGQTAANNVPGTRAEHDQRAITPNDLKPDACAAISVTAKLTGSGTITGTAASELITGSGGADTIDGGGGNDCIVGGGGVDNLRGSGGTDVCIGGAGNDSIHPSCETAIQ
jgi:Ca2+-binding RTX toxin-like protein